MKLPRWLLYTVAILVVLSWVPLALIMRARVTTSPQPRIHIVPDMDNQPKYKAQSRNPDVCRPAGHAAAGCRCRGPRYDPRRSRPDERQARLRTGWRPFQSRSIGASSNAVESATTFTARRVTGLQVLATEWSPSEPTSCSRGPGRHRRRSIPISCESDPRSSLQHHLERHPQHAGLRSADPGRGSLGHRRLCEGPAAEPERHRRRCPARHQGATAIARIPCRATHSTSLPKPGIWMASSSPLFIVCGVLAVHRHRWFTFCSPGAAKAVWTTCSKPIS